MEALPTIIIALITVISPILVSTLNRVGWSSNVKNAVAFGVALVIAVVYLIMTGGITDWTDIVGAIGTVYTLQQLVYLYLLKSISAKVEAATDPKFDKVETNADGSVVATTTEGETVVTNIPDPITVTDTDTNLVDQPKG